MTIIAGYPWYSDWGRDTFIAMHGLTLARGDFAAAGSIPTGWADRVSEGMLPNRLPYRGTTPEFNAVDASLWHANAVHEFAAAAGPRAGVRDSLRSAITAILDGNLTGVRFGIRMLARTARHGAAFGAWRL